jgi:hypothetical protein
MADLLAVANDPGRIVGKPEVILPIFGDRVLRRCPRAAGRSLQLCYNRLFHHQLTA